MGIVHVSVSKFSGTGHDEEELASSYCNYDRFFLVFLWLVIVLVEICSSTIQEELKSYVTMPSLVLPLFIIAPITQDKIKIIYNCKSTSLN